MDNNAYMQLNKEKVLLLLVLSVMLISFLILPAIAGKYEINGTAYYPLYNGSYSKTHIEKMDYNFTTGDFYMSFDSGKLRLLAWTGGWPNDYILNPITDQPVSMWSGWKAESYRTSGQGSWIEMTPLTHQFVIIDEKTLMRSMTTLSGGCLNVTYMLREGKLKFIVNRTAGTEARAQRVRYEVDFVNGMGTFQNTSKRFNPGFNYTISTLWDYSDITTPAYFSGSQWLGGYNYFQEITQGGTRYNFIVNLNGSQVMENGRSDEFDPTWSTNGSTSPVWINTTFNGSRITGDGNLAIHLKNDSQLNISGLFVYYSLDETQGTTLNSVSNETGYKNASQQGTWYGNTTLNYSSGIIGNAGLFDGVNDYIALPLNTTPVNNYSIGIWINAPNKTAQYFYGSGINSRTYIQSSLTKLQAVVGDPAVTLPDVTYNANLWYYLLVTSSYINSTYNSASFYVNGICIGSKEYSPGTWTNYNSYIGKWTEPYSNSSIDEVSIWNRNLSSSEIAILYNTSLRTQGNVTINDQASTQGYLINRTRINYTGQNSLTNASIYINGTLVQANATSETWYSIGGQYTNANFTVEMNGNGSNTPFLRYLEWDESSLVYVPSAPINYGYTRGGREGDWFNHSWEMYPSSVSCYPSSCDGWTENSLMGKEYNYWGFFGVNDVLELNSTDSMVGTNNSHMTGLTNARGIQFNIDTLNLSNYDRFVFWIKLNKSTPQWRSTYSVYLDTPGENRWGLTGNVVDSANTWQQYTLNKTDMTNGNFSSISSLLFDWETDQKPIEAWIDGVHFEMDGGNITDSYRYNLDGVWTNGTLNTSVNYTVIPGNWSNITIWSYNNSGALSLTSVGENVWVPIPDPYLNWTSVDTIKNNSAVVRWDAHIPYGYRIQYGTTTSYGGNTTYISPAYFGFKNVSGLSEDTLYHYRFELTNVTGNISYSDDYTFTTVNQTYINTTIKTARGDNEIGLTYYVNQSSGDNNNTGLSVEQAWKTLVNASSRLKAGDTLYLMNETWVNDQIRLEASGIDIAPITIKNYTGTTPHLINNDTSNSIYANYKSYIIIDGLDIYGDGGVTMRGHHNLVRNIFMHGSGGFELTDSTVMDSWNSIEYSRLTTEDAISQVNTIGINNDISGNGRAVKYVSVTGIEIYGSNQHSSIDLAGNFDFVTIDNVWFHDSINTDIYPHNAVYGNKLRYTTIKSAKLNGSKAPAYYEGIPFHDGIIENVLLWNNTICNYVNYTAITTYPASGQAQEVNLLIYNTLGFGNYNPWMHPSNLYVGSNNNDYINLQCPSFSVTPEGSPEVTYFGYIPPMSITNVNTTTWNFGILNQWTNPVSDFDHIEVRNITTDALLTNLSNTSWNRTLSSHYIQNISYQTVDAVGNVNQTRLWFNTTIPNIIPILTSIGSKSVLQEELLFFSLSGSDDDSDSIACSSNESISGSLTGCDFSWTPNSSESGLYDIRFYYNDSYGGSDYEDVSINVTTVSTSISYVAPTPENSSINRTGSIEINLTTSNIQSVALDWNNTLSLWLRFNESSGATTIEDSSGYNNNGTALGSYISNVGKYGLGGKFDGTDDNITIPSSPSINLTNNYTISGWLKPNTTSLNGYVLVKNLNAITNIEYAILRNGINQSFNVYLNGALQFGLVPKTSPDNVWSHFAFVQNSTHILAYINGTLNSTIAYSTPITPNSNSLIIGNRKTNTIFYNGSMDDLRIYRRVLTSSEIQTVYNLTANPLNITINNLPTGSTHDATAYGEASTGVVYSTEKRFWSVDLTDYSDPALPGSLGCTQSVLSVVCTWVGDL